jgi:hypothetical protein
MILVVEGRWMLWRGKIYCDVLLLVITETVVVKRLLLNRGPLSRGFTVHVL